MTINVVPDDLSEMGYIDAPSYLKWVQEVAILHWERFAPPAAQANTLWIAVKHKINYLRPGGFADTPVARTTIKRLGGVRAIFATDIVSGSRCLTQIESTWVCLNRDTRQPKALDPGVVRLFTRGP